ncbi:MAG: hypothetical protein JWM36_2252 [Hyphomicrobiales bacterium]|nr:hypothetical protein [Hyphomicrobiales bacterium]
MSEPAAKPRHSADPRQAIDLDDFERRLRDQSVGSEPNPDPLAELARLVGGENDPFKNMFAEPAPAAGRGGHLRPVQPVAVDPYAPAFDPHFDARFGGRLSGEHASANQQPQQDPQNYYQDQQAYQQPQSYQQPYDQPEAAYATPPQAEHRPYGQEYQAYGAPDRNDPDAPWLDPAMMAPPEHDLSEEFRPRRSRRATLLMSAALLIVAAGVGGTLALRSKANVSGEMPTIMASNGPVKVQPAQTAADAPKLAVSILERGSSNIADSKVVESEEQPIDLSQAARTARAGAPASRPAKSENGAPVTLAPPPPAPSIFAEPKRVRSIAVRPDGTIVQNAPAPTPSARPNDMASLVASSGASPGGSQTPSSTKGSPQVTGSNPAPKQVTRVASAAPQGMVDAGGMTMPPQTIPPTPRAPVAPRQQVAAVAPASPAAIAGKGGAFAVQLAGTTSVEEARDAANRLGKKFSSELGGLKPAVKKFDLGSKSVFRVRVSGLSSEDANSLCARLKASGGTCFVAHN